MRFVVQAIRAFIGLAACVALFYLWRDLGGVPPELAGAIATGGLVAQFMFDD